MKSGWTTGVLAGLAISAVGLALSERLTAQNPLSGRVACVDVVKIFNEYQRQRDLTEEMKQIQGRLQSENEQRRQKIDSAQATIDALDPTDPTYAEKVKALLEMQIDYKNWFDIRNAHMTREVGLWTANVYREIIQAIEATAAGSGYDVVLYRDEFQMPSFEPEAVREQIRQRKLLYASANVDISQPVLDRLNTAYRAQPAKPMIQVP